MDYYAIKHFHMACAASSGCLFLMRGYWMICNPILLQRRWVRIVPHLVDTMLLISATVLVILSRQYPFVEPWLTAKVAALVLYVILGTIALKKGRTKTVRVIAFIAAIAAFAYICTVAITKLPLPFF
ncbi:MAG TPA: SirB2 family protein [Burkholderiaceae bacterium]